MALRYILASPAVLSGGSWTVKLVRTFTTASIHFVRELLWLNDTFSRVQVLLAFYKCCLCFWRGSEEHIVLLYEVEKCNEIFASSITFLISQFLWNDRLSAFLRHLCTGWHGPLSTHILTQPVLHLRSKACWWAGSGCNFSIFDKTFSPTLIVAPSTSLSSMASPTVSCFPSCGLFLPKIYQDFYGFLCVRRCI